MGRRKKSELHSQPSATVEKSEEMASQVETDSGLSASESAPVEDKAEPMKKDKVPGKYKKFQ